MTDKYVNRFANIKDEKRRVYYAMVSALDDAVGDILNTLRKNQLDENTIVVLLSDNGGPTYTDVQSNGPLRLGKLFLFEGGIRVPFIVRWPAGLKPDKVYREPVSGLDLLPTFAAAAGAVLPKELGLDGVNLMPYLRGDSTGARMKRSSGETVPTARCARATGSWCRRATTSGCSTCPRTSARKRTWRRNDPRLSRNCKKRTIAGRRR